MHLLGQDTDSEVPLPMDAKFPQEDFERPMNAIENVGGQAIESARKSLETSIKDEGKRISSKYIKPPRTTDFAILFTPTERLFG